MVIVSRVSFLFNRVERFGLLTSRPPTQHTSFLLFPLRSSPETFSFVTHISHIDQISHNIITNFTPFFEIYSAEQAASDG
jgi:hypothetical protein